jgi:acyl-CoA thioester hydrolase
MDNCEDQYSIALEVRDYEVDLQGIVNNAVYFHYFEHARNSFIRARGLDLAAMHGSGLDPVVARAEVDYRSPLRSGDSFSIAVRASREGRFRLVFEERLELIGGSASGEAGAMVRPAGMLLAEGRFVVALLKDGRPSPIPEGTALALIPPRQD